MNPASGIIPYVKYNNEIYFLLGYENKKWSGFVGGFEESDKTIENTAIREFNEETAGIFTNQLVFIYENMLKNGILFKTKTKNRDVYIWFVEIRSENYKYYNVSERFQISKLNTTDKHFKEKEKIKWFNSKEVNDNKDLLFNLKQIIGEMKNVIK